MVKSTIIKWLVTLFNVYLKSQKPIRKTRDMTKTKVMLNLFQTYPYKHLAPRREKIPQPFYMYPYSIRPLK